jgi:hypothetical protein
MARYLDPQNDLIVNERDTEEERQEILRPTPA